jgi:hypothetical protein
MIATHPDSTTFQLLCRVLGGQDTQVFEECAASGRLQQLFDMAYAQDLLPALAVRVNEQASDVQSLGDKKALLLKQALMDNTLRNMSIKAQAVKIARQLNRVGITPLFLKGTASLLTAHVDNLGFRKQADIDVLVEPAQLEIAGDSFLADGYVFQLEPDSAASAPTLLTDTRTATKLSSSHHHLPVLVKEGYATTVELHRHHLPRRFQRGNPLEPLFASAIQFDTLGAVFKVPSTDYQIIHLILGKLVNDGHFARRTFPIREACDLIDLLVNDGERINLKIIEQHCGMKFALFHALVIELMAYRSPVPISASDNASDYIRMMQKRFDSKLVRISLDTAARVDYLSHELAYSPMKLPNYFKRVISR